MKRVVSTPCIASLVWLFVAAPAAMAAEDPAKIVRAGTEAWVKAFNDNKPDAIVALYSDDAVVLPPGSPLVRGRAALQQFFTAATAGAKSAGVSFAFGDVNDVGVSRNLAWHSGTYFVKDKSGATVESGKYLEAWRKSGGKWRIVRDIWNADAAPPGGSGAKQ
jgi:ketosteroid isomerase-like protein